MNREIGKHIKRLRMELRMTQDDLAERLHVTRQNISSWETGKSAVSVEYLTALSEIFGVSIEELIYGRCVNRTYQKFQRKYLVCIGICVAVLLLAFLSRFTLLPYLQKLQGATFVTLPGLLYGIALRAVTALSIGVFLCAFISLWGDLRLSRPIKSTLLIIGILLMLAAVFLTVLVAMLASYQQSPIWGQTFFLSLYRVWLSASILQYTVPFFASVCIFLGVNR